MDMSQIFVWIMAALIGGIILRKAWRRRMIKQYTAKELEEKLGEGAPPVLLDVRTAGEHRSGNIRNSLHIPLHELGRRLKELERYRRQEIVCYCQSGSRSLSAAARLAKEGFSVANLRGGMSEWNYHRLK